MERIGLETMENSWRHQFSDAQKANSVVKDLIWMRKKPNISNVLCTCMSLLPAKKDLIEHKKNKVEKPLPIVRLWEIF